MTTRSALCAGCERPREECRCGLVPDPLLRGVLSAAPRPAAAACQEARDLLLEALVGELRCLGRGGNPAPLLEEAMRKAVAILTQSDAALSHAVKLLCAGVLAKDHLPSAGKYERRGAFERACALVAIEMLTAEMLPAGIWNPAMEALAYDLAGITGLADLARRRIVDKQIALLIAAAKGGTPS